MRFLDKHNKDRNEQGLRLLDDYVNSLRDFSSDANPGEMKKWLLSNIYTIPQKKHKRSLGHLFVYYRHGMRLAFSIILLAVFIAAGNIPLPYNKTVGYVLTWNVKKENYSGSMFRNNEWMNNSRVVTSIANVNGIDMMTFKLIVEDEKVYERYEQDLKNDNTVFSYDVQPINRTGSRSMFRSVLNIFVRADAGNKSVEEAGAELSAQFNAAGYKNSKVVVKQGPSGKKYLFITIPVDRSSMSKPPERPPYMEIEVGSGDKTRRFVTPELLKQDATGPPELPDFEKEFAGMTDEQVKQKIQDDIRKLHNENIDAKDIEVIRINGKVVFAKLTKQRYNDPPPGPPPSYERNIDSADKEFIEKELFPDGGPGRFFRGGRPDMSPDSLMKSFPEEIISVLVEK